MSALDDLLARIEAGELGDPATVIVYVAGRDVDIPTAELAAARRRALLLLAAGGDPHRELSLDDRAVKALAHDLHSDERRRVLGAGIDALAPAVRDLPRVREVVLHLAHEPDLAWRLFALGLLAEELGDTGDEDEGSHLPG